MKQFIVDRHTTPNTPTLEQVPTEKIPVYDDMAAAAADIANLAENQIIATHDTGSELSAPVDTVQSGNMHAVTSNAVAESLSYSTEEMATGGKWIDGKPIYRKVYTGIVANTTGYNVLGGIISNIDSIIKLGGIVDNLLQPAGSSRGMQIPNRYINLVYDDTNGINLNYPPSDVTSYKHYVIIIEYTKTTN